MDGPINHFDAIKFRKKEQFQILMVSARVGRCVMTAKDILKEDASNFATRLEAMTSDEVFSAMRLLEKHSEDDISDREVTLSRIALVEEEIERRFPGQMSAPYRNWKKEQPLSS